MSCSISITSACRPNAISCSASPRNRLEISWCSASAVRFIGTQRPSIAIENDVSTSRATAAWVRASVSSTSTSRMSRRTPAARVAALGRGADDGVGDGAGHVPRLGVAEGPLAGGAADARRPRRPERRSRWPWRPDIRLATSLSSALPSWRIASRREPELAVGAALEVAGVAQRPLELAQGPGVDGGLVAELAGQLVEVDVVHPGAAVGLGELLGEVVEVGEVLEHAGAVAEAEALLAVEALGAAPVLAGAQRLEVVVELAERLHQLGRAERLGWPGRRARRAAPGVIELRIRWAGRRALGQRVHQLVDVLRVLGEEVAVLVHEVGELLVGVLAAPVRLQQLVEVVRASR